MAKKKIKVALGLSGGVDSSVAAFLLKEAGYEVLAFHLKLHEGIDPFHTKACCSLDSSLEARMVAHELEIPFYMMNMKREFEEQVIRPFVRDYDQGQTPNPCIACNRYIKFGVFLEKAKKLGADYLATGHYAKVYQEDGRTRVARAIDEKKDQTYMLWGLMQEQLRHILMPLGDVESKQKVREIANKLGLSGASNPDSQEICFVTDNDHRRFLREAGVNFNEGDFVLRDGTKLGRHQGLAAYTIGQRKGLGISYEKPLYVIGFDRNKNQVILGDNEDLFKKTLVANELNLIYEDLPEGQSKDLVAKIRYSTKTYACRMTRTSKDSCQVVFEEAVRAITPGQSVVFYHGLDLYGGAIIQKDRL